MLSAVIVFTHPQVYMCCYAKTPRYIQTVALLNQRLELKLAWGFSSTIWHSDSFSATFGSFGLH